MEEKPGDLERSPTARSLSQMPQESQALDVIIEDADTSLTEIEPVVANTWTMPPAAKPVTKLKPTYNVPVSKFAGAALFGESKPASEAKPAVTPFTFSASPTNPFSVAGANPPSTITPAGLFGFKAQPPASSSRMPESLISKSLYKTGDLKTSHFGFAKPNALFVSDGMGGSRSRYATKKTTTQAKLPWGPKKA
ncbi:hypothetical protein FBU59_006960 [Linderina macrospora]|uniref:Uncharacterized protein n=1 Tax=Linderina macrospora TaxID=4868 RepID=A0ACC1IYD6_9FUNG|nr:hypothetical protein FBU59_006960 [Linderina macrospora]